jgi:hypothetical protein
VDAGETVALDVLGRITGLALGTGTVLSFFGVTIATSSSDNGTSNMSRSDVGLTDFFIDGRADAVLVTFGLATVDSAGVVARDRVLDLTAGSFTA